MDGRMGVINWRCGSCGFSPSMGINPSVPVHCICGAVDRKPIGRPVSTRRPLGGVGTELKAILSWFNIKADDRCGCERRALQMDAYGVPWCRQNIHTVVGWLQEAAKKRNMCFVRFAGYAAVKLAIHRATRAADRSPTAE